MSIIHCLDTVCIKINFMMKFIWTINYILRKWKPEINKFFELDIFMLPILK